MTTEIWKQRCVILFMSISLCFSLGAKGIDASLEESLDLRKIAEYWAEKEYTAVKMRIEDFLSKNPLGPHTNQLYAMLGDLHFLEKNYREAITAYDHIEKKELRLTSQFHRLHGLHAMGSYEEFIRSSELFLNTPAARAEQTHLIRFELAECYFRLAHTPEQGAKRKELLAKAFNEYRQLTQTQYGAMALEPQAEIHTFLEEYPQAAALYLQLATQDLARKEDYLFQAAALQMHFDKNAAINTFDSIVKLKEKHASKAAFNALNLLFQEKRYKDFILTLDKTQALIPAEQVPLFHYYLGRSLLHTQDYRAAIQPLSQSLASKKLGQAQEKNALISLIVCAKETQDFPLLEMTLSQLKSACAEEGEKNHALLMYSELCKEKKEWTRARGSLQEILEKIPQHPQRETLLYDVALLYSHEHLFQEAADAFENFLKLFPESAHRQSALRHLVNLRFEEMKCASNSTQKIKKELLRGTLKMALEEKKLFNPAERQKVHYLLGKTHCELEEYEEAIGQLTEYTQEYRSDPTCIEAYLLLAHCYKQEDGDEIYFTLNAEKALARNPALPGALDLHVALYNAYLTLAIEADAEEKSTLIAKAADHLFLALDKPIHKDNQRWLAGYYFHESQKGAAETGKRSILILEKLLGISSQDENIAFPVRGAEGEGEALKLAAIYGELGRLKDRARLLEALKTAQTSHPDLEWKYSRMTEFELAKAWEALDEKEKALSTYDELIASSSHTPSYFATAAKLERTKLAFSMLKPEERCEKEPSVIALCDTLKTLQVQRKLHSEPLHLEAALCYIDIKTELSPVQERLSRRQFLLEQMKKHLTSTQDPFVQEYLSASEQFPEKDRLFWHYIDYIDAERLRLNAELYQNPSQKEEALDQFEQLLTKSTDPHLKRHIQKSKEAL
jgi:tetratricopeptide (TPR) repeat protein